MRPRTILPCLFALSGCSRAAPSDAVAPPPPPASVTVAPAPSAASAPIVAAQPDAPPAADAGPPLRGGYPVGHACSDPKAIAAEKRTLPPLSAWTTVDSAKQRIQLRVPPGVFKVDDREGGLDLRSSLKAAGLGPAPSYHVFALRVRRLARSVDALLADRQKGAPLADVYVEGAFPKRTTASFVAEPDEPMGSGAAVKTSIAGKPAWVWINGVEGYDTDYALVALGAADTLFVTADWNTSIMAGQPECWQRAVIGGVVDSVVPRP